MKRFIAAVSFAVLAVPAFAAEMGAPFEQTELDRALPQIEISATGSRNVEISSRPFEQTELDRALPSIGGENVRFAAASGNTASDASVGNEPAGYEPAGYVWANDHNFISPAP